MAKKFIQGVYKPINPQKYIGNQLPVYKSGWELILFRHLDRHPYVIYWSYEPVRIPYFNPDTQKQTVYVPDFYVMWYKNNKKTASLLEIKPKEQAMVEYAKTAANRRILLVNYAKWAAAMKWASKHGIGFQVLTEDQLLHQGKIK